MSREELVLGVYVIGLGVLLISFAGVAKAARARDSQKLRNLTVLLGAALCCYIASCLVVGGISVLAGGS
jgi:hypothetical protein